MSIECKVNPLSRRDIRIYANTLRKICGIENDLYVDVVGLFEKLSNRGLIEIEIVSDKEMPGKYAETSPTEGHINIRESIYLKAIEGDNYARSTFPHEFFHLTHDVKSITFCRSEKEVKERKAYENPEWQADCFAGEFLVPKHLVKGMTISEVMKKCHVSYGMARCQLNKYREEGQI